MKINYPIKKTATKVTTTANRGMNLEADLNQTNEYYLVTNKAVIHKKPVPIKVVNVHYPSRQAAEITKAFFTTPSTTDYNGIYQGRYVDFEAKETSNETSFPLSNIHPHQVDHLLSIEAHGGIGFVIIAFTKSQELYALWANDLAAFYQRQQTGGRKSIAKTELESVAIKLHYGLHPRIDYLAAIDQRLQQEAEDNASK